MSNISVTGAEFLHDNTLLVFFSDGHEQVVDFAPFLSRDSIPEYFKDYKREDKFREFQIEAGNLVWGEDWDLIFPVSDLYSGKIN